VVLVQPKRLASGVLILVWPFAVDERVNGLVTLNAVVVGLVVTIAAQFELFGPTVRDEVVNGACGLWLILSPMVFGYSWADQLKLWHFGLGAVVTVIAGLELWQEWQKADR
jgi:hypothetical protein